MNEIEKRFYKAYQDYENANGTMFELEPQQVIGIYKVDFLYGRCAVEIDGHEYHKTKEQRLYDYQRERFLLKNNYIPVRFMATEVFLNPTACVLEMNLIAETIENHDVDIWYEAQDEAEQAMKMINGGD